MSRPGVQLLPTVAAKNKTTVPALQSRIIGLTDLAAADATAADGRAVPGAATPPLASSRQVLPTAAGRSQWPTGVHSPALAGQWQAPAAPYLGAGSGAFFPPPPPAPPRPRAAAPSAGAAGGHNARFQAGEWRCCCRGHHPAPAAPEAGDLNFDPDPELPAVQHPAVFEQTTAEIGAAEAADLSAPQDDLVPDAPAADDVAPAAAAGAALLPAPAAPSAPTVLIPRLDGLNFRMIQ